MRQTSYCLLIFLTTITASTAQDQVVTGAGYSKHAFYSLTTGKSQQLNLDAWDLAFSATGQQDGGIHFNEGVISSMTTPATDFSAFLAKSTNFEQVDTAGMTRLYNPETSWLQGAFNVPAAAGSASDYGWGVYNPAQRKVVGNRIFVLRTRQKQFKKFVVDELGGDNVYRGRYANLDGSDLKTFSIAKSAAAGAPLLFLKLSDGAITPSPKDWDLLFTRYVTPLLDPGTNQILAYNVTGTLSGPGVSIAKVDGINPATVAFAPYKDSLRSRLDVIGHDWKNFGFQSGWTVDKDRVYFIKTAESRLWKVQFIDFEGSSTGASTLIKTDLGLLTSVKSPAAARVKVLLYPNPVVDQFNLSLDLPDQFPATGRLLLTDLYGRTVLEHNLALAQGLQIESVDGVAQLPAATYVARLVCADFEVVLGTIVKW